MSQDQDPIGGQRSNDLISRLRPIAERAFDLLTITPIWKAYAQAGTKGAAITGFFLWFVWSMVIGIPLAVVWAILAPLGIVEAEGWAEPAIFLAVVPTVYGGYRAWRLIQDRKIVLELFQNPTIENGAKGFEYLDDDDDFVRANGAGVIARAMEEHNVGRVIKQAGLDQDDAAYRLADLLHDDDEDVRLWGSEALAFFSIGFAESVTQFRDDVFAATSYSTPMVQGNAAIIAGNMASNDPNLADDVMEQIEPLCEDVSPDVRGLTATALALTPTERAEELLVGLTEDTDPDVRQHAQEMLRRRRNEGGQPQGGQTTYDVSQVTQK